MKMYGTIMQWNSKTLYEMLELSVSSPNSYPQPKSSLINRLINDRLLDVKKTSPQLIGISHRLLVEPLL